MDSMNDDDDDDESDLPARQADRGGVRLKTVRDVISSAVGSVYPPQRARLVGEHFTAAIDIVSFCYRSID
jgi:hypothetical protein